MFVGEKRMEAGEDKESINRPSRVKLLTLLILILLILTPIILSVYLYYLPLNDVEVIVYDTSRNTDPISNESYILLKMSVTNKGSISHYVYLTGSVVFSTEPDVVYTETSRSNLPIDPGATYPVIRVRVPVPVEVLQDPYEASCSVTLPPPVNKYDIGLIVPATIVWLVGITAVSTSLVMSRRKKR